ncbi:MAG TPA: hypothetical protein VF141_03045, partial [Chryseolinea sp.]
MYFRNSINVRPTPHLGINPVRIFMLIGIFMIASQGVAQISQPRRFEVAHKSSDDQYTIISLKEEGLALFH